MQKITVIFSILFFFVLISVRNIVYSSGLSNYQSVNETDYRVNKLKNFFNLYHSPLLPYASYFIKEADYYHVDWRLIPAISGVESSLGKYIPKDSFNAYGWDNGTYRFFNWYHSISHVTQKIATNYIAKGATSIEYMAPIYNPVTPIDWGNHVKYFVYILENTPPNISEVLHLTVEI